MSTIEDKIAAALAQIEKESDVRILMAVESGSRAWGFASPDSDFDVRFVYVHKPDWYLSVTESRDVIDKMLPDMLDVNGWELRKALRLMSKCNVALNEWIGSPIRYSDTPGFQPSIANLIPLYFNPISSIYHYRSMAETALEANLNGSKIKIKKLFYVLRPLLACLWIEHERTQPPTEFSKLLTPSWSNALDPNWIAELQTTKAVAAEAEELELRPDRIELLRGLIACYKNAAEKIPAASISNADPLNDLLRTWVKR